MIISKEELSKYIKRLSILYLDVKRAENEGYSFFELRCVPTDKTVLSEALKSVLSLLQRAEEQCSFDYVDTDNVRFYPYIDIASVYPKFKADIKTLNSVYGMGLTQRKGKWRDIAPHSCFCNQCCNVEHYHSNFCPKCGAQMETDDE